MKTTELIIQGQQLESLVTTLTQFQTQQYMVKVNVVQANNVAVITSEKVYFRVNAFFMQTIVLDLSHSSEGRIHIITGGGPAIGLGSTSHMHKSVIGFLQDICHKSSWILKESKLSS